MREVFLSPERLPPSLIGLGDLVAERLPDSSVESIAEISSHTITGDNPALIVVTDLVIERGVPLEGLINDVTNVAETTPADLIFVTGDGYLGTDGPHLKQAAAGAAMIALARSLATRRERRARSNVVCVPDLMFGNEGSQASPLPQPVEAVDVAATIAYLLDDSGLYVNGQVIYVDGGRHLLSSHTA